MTRNVDNRLKQLRNRRGGGDRLFKIDEGYRHEVLAKSMIQEGWQKRAPAQPNTRYAIGAMEAVDADYTRISVETAERVGEQLRKGLTDKGFRVDFRLQGSVPLNVHIRGVSDVDLLTLDDSFLTYANSGPLSVRGFYTNPSSLTSLGVLQTLRKEAAAILRNKYPAADVDTTGGKAIAISGGSLARPVDVVPSHWFDSIEYQTSGQAYDRGVTILDAKIPQTLDNFPFLHIKAVTDRCDLTFGGLRKAIRLCKNVKADAIDEGTQITLPSFDIAGLMYHANMSALSNGLVFDLAVLAEAQRHLDHLYNNQAYAKTLKTPDGSRFILDTTAKMEGLMRLSVEMDDLAREVAKEQKPTIGLSGEPSLADSRTAIESQLVPA